MNGKEVPPNVVAHMRALLERDLITKRAREYVAALPSGPLDRSSRATLRRLLDDACLAEAGRPVLSREVRRIQEGGVEVFEEIHGTWVAQAITSGLMGRRSPHGREVAEWMSEWMGITWQGEDDEGDEDVAASSEEPLATEDVQEEPRTCPA